MTKIQMPEPVAYAIFAENNIRLWSNEPQDLPDLDCLGPMHQLITTDQAEAYADARVREALLEAYGSMQELHMSLLNDATPYVHPAQIASFAANRISALMPKRENPYETA